MALIGRLNADHHVIFAPFDMSPLISDVRPARIACGDGRRNYFLQPIHALVQAPDVALDRDNVVVGVSVHGYSSIG